MNDPSDKLTHLKTLFSNIPRGFKSAAKQTIQLLSQIQKNSSITKMDILKLSKIFGPIFLRPREESYYMKGDEAMITEVMKILLDDTQAYFPVCFFCFLCFLFLR